MFLSARKIQTLGLLKFELNGISPTDMEKVSVIDVYLIPSPALNPSQAGRVVFDELFFTRVSVQLMLV